MTRIRLLAATSVASAIAIGVASSSAASTAAVSPGDPDPSPRAPSVATAPVAQQDINAPYDGLYHFARIRYGDGGGGGGGFGRRRRRGGMWAHDWPRADLNFMKIIEETTFIGALTDGSNVVALDEPDLFKYPITYIVEPGYWNPTDEEAMNLGEYLLKGGFLIVDDFRGPRELDNLAFHLSRIVPGLNMMEVEESHEIFDSFFRIVPSQVVPPYGGYPPVWYGLYEDNDRSKRLLVMINANNDMAEYWEFSDRGYYPIDLANEAYKLGVNYVVYGLTH